APSGVALESLSDIRKDLPVDRHGLVELVVHRPVGVADDPEGGAAVHLVEENGVGIVSAGDSRDGEADAEAAGSQVILELETDLGGTASRQIRKSNRLVEGRCAREVHPCHVTDEEADGQVACIDMAPDRSLDRYGVPEAERPAGGALAVAQLNRFDLHVAGTVPHVSGNVDRYRDRPRELTVALQSVAVGLLLNMPQVEVRTTLRVAEEGRLPLLEKERLLADASHGVGRVADEKHRQTAVT